MKRCALRRRYGRAVGGGSLDRLLSGEGPYYYEHDRQMNILIDLARPRGKRKLPPPTHNLVFDRAYDELAKEGFVHWVYETPDVQTLGLDRYELTPKGKRAIKVHDEWVQRVIVGPAKGGRR
jgi:hypothetical protein